MNQTIKAEWILELTKWKQGKNCLGRYDERCCLGVLCEVAVRHGIIDPPKVNPADGSLMYGENAEDAILPIEVVLWAGLDDRNPIVKKTSLSKLNDNGVNFLKIAETIKHNL